MSSRPRPLLTPVMSQVRCVMALLLLGRDTDERLDRPPLVHRLVSLDDMIEVRLEVEDTTRVDLAREDVGEERRDDQVTGPEVAHVSAYLVDDADELVADRTEIVGREPAVVPEIRAADAGERHADDRVGRAREDRVGALADGDVEGPP